MDLSDHLNVIGRHWWRIILASVIVAVAVYGLRRSVPEEYASTSLVRVVVQNNLGSDLSEDNVAFVGRSYALLGHIRPVVRDAARRAGSDVTGSVVAGAVSIDDSTAGYLTIRAVAKSPELAARIAGAEADALSAAVATQEENQRAALLKPVQQQGDALARQLASLGSNDPTRSAMEAQYSALVQSISDLSLRPLNRLDVVAPAQVNATPVSPRPKRDAALALVLALIINAELAVALAALGDRFPKADVSAAVTAATGLPVLGEIPHGDEEEVIEATRSLRTNLLFMDALSSVRSIAVTGGEAGCGKSFVSANLAVSIAELDIPVKLVDADVRRPRLHDYLGLARSPGLTDALTMDSPWDVAKVVPRCPGLRFLPAGTELARDPAALFASDAFKTKVLQPGSDAALVIVDTPPLGLFADALAVASQCDGVLFVVDAMKSRRRRVTRSLRMLEQLGIRPIGIVINRSQAEGIKRYYGSGGNRPATAERPTITTNAPSPRRR